MPIVEPEHFGAFNLLPFQINPHYLDANPQGHAGETRETRIREFLAANQDMLVVGLREGTMLLVSGSSVQLKGPRNARIFSYNKEPLELSGSDSFDFLMH